MTPKELEEAFIKVTFEEDSIGSGPQTGVNAEDPFYDSWVDQGGLYACGSDGGLYKLSVLTS